MDNSIPRGRKEHGAQTYMRQEDPTNPIQAIPRHGATRVLVR